MTTSPRFALAAFLIAAVLVPAAASGQGAVADYERAMTLRDTYQGLAVNVPEQPSWIERTNRFWYRRSVRGGNEFVLVNAETQTKQAPFDHAKLAAGISSATGGKYTAMTLPFTTFTFVDNDRAIEFSLSSGGPGGGAGRGAPPGGPGGPPMWRCALDTYTCRPPATGGRGGRGDAAEAADWAAPFGLSSTSTARSRKSPRARSSKRSSTTTTSRSARPASAKSRRSARTDPKGATTIPTRWCGHPIQRRLPCTK